MPRVSFPEIVREKVKALKPTSAFLEHDEDGTVWNRRRFGSRVNLTRQIVPGTENQLIMAHVSGGKNKKKVIDELIAALGDPSQNIASFRNMPKTTFLEWPSSRLTQLSAE